MSQDRSFVRAIGLRSVSALATRLTDAELLHPVGEH
jgi:hypothetical protein